MRSVLSGVRSSEKFRRKTFLETLQVAVTSLNQSLFKTAQAGYLKSQLSISVLRDSLNKASLFFLDSRDLRSQPLNP